MCTNFDKEGSEEEEEDIDGETNEIHKGHEIQCVSSVGLYYVT